MINQILFNIILQYYIYIVSYLVTIIGGSAFVEFVLKQVEFSEEQKKALLEESVKGAGRIIGMLERVLVLTFILMNQPTAIAVIFAAKSIVRFETMKSRPYAEYYLIGTLTSIIFAILIGITTNYLLTSFHLKSFEIIFVLP